MRNLVFYTIAAFALTACQTTTAPKKEPTPEQRAEIEKAQAEYVAANCALYKKIKESQPSVELPANCKP